MLRLKEVASQFQTFSKHALENKTTMVKLRIVGMALAATSG